MERQRGLTFGGRSAQPPQTSETLPAVRSPIAPEVLREMMSVATHLADIQIPDVEDDTGFSNSDVALGRALVSIVSADPSNEQSIRALAGLVGFKYQDQVTGIVGEARVRQFQDVAGTREISRATRELVRRTVVVEKGAAGKVFFRLQGDAKLRTIFTRHQAVQTDDGPKGRRFDVRDGMMASLVAQLKAGGAVFVGENLLPDLRFVRRERLKRQARTTLIGISPASRSGWLSITFDYDPAFTDAVKLVRPDLRRWDGEQKAWMVAQGGLGALRDALETRGADVSLVDAYIKENSIAQSAPAAIGVQVSGNRASLSFPYHPELVAAVKALPTKRFDGDTKAWKDIPLADLGSFLARVEHVVGFDYSALREAAARTPQPIVYDLDPSRLKPLFPHQVEGVRFLTQPLEVVRSQVADGETIRGMVLGDSMGLGKTVQAALAADCVMVAHERAGERARTVVVAPASLLTNWRREIYKFVGFDQSVHVVTNEKGLNPFARWNLISYDIVGDQYQALKNMGYDVLIVDEAHFTKTYSSIRSAYVVGGKIGIDREGKAIYTNGLAAAVRTGCSRLPGRRCPTISRTPTHSGG
jgi:SNF2 domain-containing protein